MRILRSERIGAVCLASLFAGVHGLAQRPTPTTFKITGGHTLRISCCTFPPLSVALPNASSCVLLVGHNPGFEDLVSSLVGSQQEMPTAALACIEFEIDSWEDVEDGGGRLIWLLTPKQQRGDDKA